MSIGAWFRRLLSPRPDDEAVEREEYGAQDRGETELEEDGLSGRAYGGGAEAAEEVSTSSGARPIRLHSRARRAAHDERTRKGAIVMADVEEGTRFRIDGRVFSYIGDGEDAEGKPVAHLRAEDSGDLEEYPLQALASLERA